MCTSSPPEASPGDAVLADLHRAADAAVEALAALADPAAPGDRPGQYALDLAADAAISEVLLAAGYAIVSEEGGTVGGPAPLVVVVDPVDGSENAARGRPGWATSLCALAGDELVAAVVHDHERSTRYDARRGGGARRDGVPIAVSGCDALHRATVALSGHLPRRPGWHADRAWGAAALELCAVAEGAFDAFVDADVDAHGPWDYLGGLLVCIEAGAAVAERLGRPLLTSAWSARRSPLVAATPELLAELEAALAVATDDWVAATAAP